MNTHTSTILKSAFCSLMMVTALFGQLEAPVQAQVFDGGGIQEGLSKAGDVQGIAKGNPRQVVIRAIETILNFLGLIATIMIIIAGFYLVLSFGNEENRDKAKKIIIYTLIGLFIILVSRIIVSLVTIFLADQV